MSRATEPSPGHSIVIKIIAALFLVGGSMLLLKTLAGWQKEFAYDPGISLGTAKVVQINPRPPADSSQKVSHFRCYPVFEYFERSGRRRHLAGKAALVGYFNVGDEVPIAQLGARVTVMDPWFRSQDYGAATFIGALAIGLGIVIIKTNRTKPRADAETHPSGPRDRAIY